MSQKEINRKLSCILSTDAVGYSRLMEDDEASTVEHLEENKKLISRLIEENKGRVVDSPGDNLLAEFNSAVKAVDCAVKIQKELKIKNAELVENRRMQFRIGINLGDVIEEDGRLYGSGVNIAARLEGLAKPGGICIARNVYDQVKTVLDLGYEYLGEHHVKNISEPVRAYTILTGSEHVGKAIGEKRKGGINNKIAIAAVLFIIAIGWFIYSHQSKNYATRTIAVLPFDDRTSDKDQEDFVKILSEKIGSLLNYVPNLSVKNVPSTKFREENKTYREMGDELQVDYILDGYVGKQNNNLYIRVKLINASDSGELWSDTYDEKKQDFTKIHEKIYRDVAEELNITTGIEKYLKQLGGTKNTDAQKHLFTAWRRLRKPNYDSDTLDIFYQKTLDSINAAINFDPNYALAHVLKCHLHNILSSRCSTEKEAARHRNHALEAANRAINLKPELAEAYAALGDCKSITGDWIGAEKAYIEAQKRVDVKFLTNSIIHWHYQAVGDFKKTDIILKKMKGIDYYNHMVRFSSILNFGFLDDILKAEEEYKICKKELGESFPPMTIGFVRLSGDDVVTKDDIFSNPGDINDIAKEYLDSHEKGVRNEKGLEALHRIYDDEDKKLLSSSFIDISMWAAYFGDPEFALDALIKGTTSKSYRIAINYAWLPHMREMRQLPGFKEYVRKIGLVDYWEKYDWPDSNICYKVDYDFKCN